jgi:hypothetical protein
MLGLFASLILLQYDVILSEAERRGAQSKDLLFGRTITFEKPAFPGTKIGAHFPPPSSHAN